MTHDGGKPPDHCVSEEAHEIASPPPGRRVKLAGIAPALVARRPPSPMKSVPHAASAVLAFVVLGCGSNAGSGDPVPSVGSSRAAIVGGEVDSTTTGVVGLAIFFTGHQFFGSCSGTLIAPNLVLTARHCVSLLTNSTDEQVQCGVTGFTPVNRQDGFLASSSTTRPMDPTDPTYFRSIQVHVPDGSTEFCGQDVALIVLSGEGMPASMATPVVPRIDIAPVPGEPFTTEGYGLTDPNSDNTDGTRMRGSGSTVRCVGTDCQTRSDTVRNTEWLSEDARTCPGDSGGPAIDAQGRVMGVTSRGPQGCTSTVYGNVSSWRDFIISTAIDAAARGGYDPPSWTSGVSLPGPDSADSGSGVPESKLGKSCSGGCGAGYECYADDGKPPGVCVPKCGSDGGACPSGYECAASLDACVPKGSSVLSAQSSGGCAVTAAPSTGSAESVAGLVACVGAAAFARRRRRGVTMWG
jgi:hypothetical protein